MAALVAVGVVLVAVGGDRVVVGGEASVRDVSSKRLALWSGK